MRRRGVQPALGPLLSMVITVSLGGCLGQLSDAPSDAPGAEGRSGRGGDGRGGASPGASEPPATLDDLEVYSRLTKPEYRYVALDLLNGAETAARDAVLREVEAFNENNYTGFYKNYDPISVYPGLEISQLSLARALATAFPASDLYRRLCITRCAENVADKLLPRIWKRRLAPGERDDLLALYASFPEASRDYYFFLRVFASPFFHYKIFSLSPGDADARNIKDAQLVSFALTGSFPDAALQADVDSGTIADPGRWAHHIERLLAAHATRFATLFVPQWLGMASAYESEETYEGVALSTIMTEPALIFSDALSHGGSVSSLFSLESNVVSAELARLYGVEPATAGGGWQRQAITPTLFGTAAMSYLTVDHESGNPSPIRRGSYIVNHVLCKQISFPPSEVQAEVDRVVSNAPEGLSPPDRMAYFRSHSTCAGCHTQFDPYGLALEEIGALGEARDRYYTGDPIEAAGTAGEITYTSSVDFAHQLAETEALNTCFASQVYAYLSSSPHVAVNHGLRPRGEELQAMSAAEIVAEMVLRVLGERE